MGSSLGIEACELDRGLAVGFCVCAGVYLPFIDICMVFLTGRPLVLLAGRSQVLRFSHCSCLWHIVAESSLEILRGQPLHACLKAGSVGTRMPRVLMKNFSTDKFRCWKAFTYVCFVIIGEHIGGVIAIIFHLIVIIVAETRPKRQVLVDALLTTLKYKIRVVPHSGITRGTCSLIWSTTLGFAEGVEPFDFAANAAGHLVGLACCAGPATDWAIFHLEAQVDMMPQVEQLLLGE